MYNYTIIAFWNCNYGNLRIYYPSIAGLTLLVQNMSQWINYSVTAQQSIVWMCPSTLLACSVEITKFQIKFSTEINNRFRGFCFKLCIVTFLSHSDQKTFRPKILALPFFYIIMQKTIKSQKKCTIKKIFRFRYLHFAAGFETFGID